MPSISFATFGFLASHCDIEASEVVARSPAPDASAFCTIVLGGPGREQFVSPKLPTSRPAANMVCFSRITPLCISNYHLMTPHSKSPAIAGCRTGRKELLRRGGSGCVLLYLRSLIRLFA